MEEPIINDFMQMTITNNEAGGLHATVLLCDLVSHSYHYIPLMNFLTDATEKDTCLINIDNDGGILNTGIALGTMIERTKAAVITSSLSIAASAAALIFTKGKQKKAFDWGYVMYHTASYLNYGTVKAHEDQLAFIKELITRIMKETEDQKLITPQDVNDVLTKAKDIFVPGHVINQRLTINKGGSD